MKRAFVGVIGLVCLCVGCGSSKSTGAAGDGGRGGGGQTFAVGGTVSGLAGGGLALGDNAGDVVMISADGAFTMPTRFAIGSDVNVSVVQQPTGPSQTCVVALGVRTGLSHDVTDIAVTCTTNRYAIAGSVTGLAGSGLVLTDNGGDDLAVAANGSFTFATPVSSGATFTVAVKTQPSSPTQTCTVMGGSGTVGGGDVTSVAVNCSTNAYTIGGTVSGLSGGGLVLQDDGGDDLSVTADGSFAFATPIPSGGAFAVTVKTQPSSPTQTCSVSMGAGTVVAANVTTVTVHCSTNAYAVGGTVTGLAGSGLVLQDNLGDNLPISGDGAFGFATKVASGAAYSVTVLAQPTSRSQTCTVGNGSGLVGSADITNVAVVCTTNTYAIGGTVTGLQGAGLVLQDNGGDDLAVNADGSFSFATKVASGDGFSVTVLDQPTNIWQTCTVSGGSGTVTNADVTTVVVNCTANQYAIGGTVSGLDGTGLQLSLDGGAAIDISADGTYAFPNTLASGTTYTVTVVGQPTHNWQTCVVSGGSGTVAGSDVTNVDIDCTTNRYAIGGSVTGLAGSGLVLQDDAGDDLAVAADGTFAFTTKIASGQPYAVTVSQQPTNPWQTCAVTNAAGTVAGADITNVAVTCTTNTYAVGGTISGLAGTVVLQNDLGDDLTLSADGTFTFATKLASGSNYSVTVRTQPGSPSQTCTVTSGSGTLTDADVTDVSVTCVTNRYVIGGTVTGLVGGGLVLQDNGGDDLSITADGTFRFATKVASGDTYAVTVATQPSAPTQTCVVTGDSGTVGGADVTSVVVNCTTNTYTVGGTLSGLGTATGLVLQQNGGDDLSVSADGSFAFVTPVASGDAYAVTVKTQPTAPWETCTVTSGTGTVTNADVTSVQVACTVNRYAVQVSVTGVAGSGLVLQDNGGDNLAIGADGTYSFATTIASGSTYDVTVLTQPTTPWQTCTVASPTGTMGDGVTLAVTCATNEYAIGGTVSGLTGSGLVLRDNGGDDLSIAANGTFSFTTKVASGASYDVTVATQPSGPTQTCVVRNGSGTVSSQDVSAVVVDCTGDTFRITSLTANNCASTQVATYDGDDRGGLVVSTNKAFITGDSGTASTNLDLSSPGAIGHLWDGLVSDLRTRTVYALGGAAAPFSWTFSSAPATQTFDHLWVLDPQTGAATTSITLSAAISVTTQYPPICGVFSGWGRALVYNGSKMYNIDLPSGVVTDLGAMTMPAMYPSESWAVWGVAEYFGGSFYVDVALGGTYPVTQIGRVHVPDAATTTLASFTSLSDLASFNFDVSSNRWYWHYEGSGQFGSGDESLGYCDATFDNP